VDNNAYSSLLNLRVLGNEHSELAKQNPDETHQDFFYGIANQVTSSVHCKKY